MRTPRPTRALLAAALGALAIAGCSSESTTSTAPGAGEATISPAPSGSVAETGAPTTLAVTTTVPASAPTTVEVDPAVVIADAFAAISPGYHFVTTANIGADEVVAAEGDRVDQRTRMSVSSNGATVDYVVAPEGAWASIDGGWQQLEQPPITDPLGPLRTPESLSVVTVDGSIVTLAATYPPSALSLPGDEPVTVRFVIDGTSLRSMAYETVTQAGLAKVDATISPLADATPVELPTV